MSDNTDDTPQTRYRDSASFRWLLVAIIAVLFALAAYWLLGGTLLDSTSGEATDIEEVLSL